MTLIEVREPDPGPVTGDYIISAELTIDNTVEPLAKRGLMALVLPEPRKPSLTIQYNSGDTRTFEGQIALDLAPQVKEWCSWLYWSAVTRSEQPPKLDVRLR